MSNSLHPVPSSSKGDGLESVVSKTGAGKKQVKPKPLSADEAARAIVQKIRTGESIDQVIVDRFPVEWKAAELAAHEGEQGLRNWFRAEEMRLVDDPAKLREIRSTVEKALAEPPPTIPLFEAESSPPQRRLKAISAASLHEMDFRVEWLVKRVLVADQPAVVVAPKKSLKTSVMIDLAVSLATATPLLGYFEVPRPRKVLFLSGEAGGFEVRNRLDRVCASRDCTLPDLGENLFVCLEDLPRLTEPEDLAELGEVIEETGAEVVILDPLYLCLMSGSRPVDAANLFQMGPLLASANRVCKDHGATLILVHHMRKTKREDDKPDLGEASQPELEDIAYAGVQEFARQWIMLKRRKRYEPGTGNHHIWFSAGGSAISGGCWAVDIAEGVQDEHFAGQVWAPTVIPERDAIQKEQDDKARAKRSREQAKEIETLDKLRKHEEQIIEALNLYGKNPKNFIISNAKLNGDNGRSAIDRLAAAGRIVVEDGKNKQVLLSLPEPNFGAA